MTRPHAAEIRANLERAEESLHAAKDLLQMSGITASLSMFREMMPNGLLRPHRIS